MGQNVSRAKFFFSIYSQI